VFAAVCVLLAAAGHGLAVGDMPPLRAEAGGFLAVLALGWALGGRERSLPGIGVTMLSVQAGLHLVFAAAHRGGTEHARAVSPRMAAIPGHAMVAVHAHAIPSQTGVQPTVTAHATAAHVLAALAASWWLWRGEAMLWSLLRRARALVPGLVAWCRDAPQPAPAGHAPRVPVDPGSPRRALLRHAVSRRGPPVPIPYPLRPPHTSPVRRSTHLMSTSRSTPRRAATLTVLAATSVLFAAGIASAHVTVHPESYAKGATDGVLTFRVPNEEDGATTTKVQVFLPTDQPVLGVLVHPQDGWSAKVTTTKLKTPVKTDDGTITEAASEITFSGGKIGAGQYEDFDVAFGQLPEDAGQLTFKTLQTYSDGKVVRWIEEPAGGEEPENPAPVLKLTAGDATGDTAAAPAQAKSADTTRADGASDSTARGLGIAGLVAGLLGLAAAAFAIVRSRGAQS
jgi:uncharacterized protein YcnI